MPDETINRGVQAIHFAPTTTTVFEFNSMIQKLLNCLARVPKGGMTGFALLLVFLVGIIDFAIGLDLQLTFFYLFPIGLASWFVSRKIGLLTAVLCTLTWFLSNQLGGMRHAPDFIAVCNFAMRAAVSTLIAYTLAELEEIDLVDSPLALN